MSLSANSKPRTQVQPARLQYGITSGAIEIFEGALLNFSSGGYVKKASNTHGEKFAGIALEHKNLAAADNTAGGTFTVEVIPAGSGELVELTITSTITILDVGKRVWADDDDSVDIVADGQKNDTAGQVGIIKQYISANKALVQLTNRQTA